MSTLRFHANLATAWAPAEPVTDIRTQVRPHLLPMYRLLDKLGGISLAAQQVGLQLCFFIWNDHRGGMRFTQTIINPRVVYSTPDVIQENESDMSAPGVTLSLARPMGIKASWTDAAGEEISERFLTGMAARVFLHEVERMGGHSVFKNKAGGPTATPGKESIGKASVA